MCDSSGARVLVTRDGEDSGALSPAARTRSEHCPEIIISRQKPTELSF